jgi:methylmalonyl-CoA mutase cobalamin-binding domain/chain
MTHRERILRVMRGETVDVIPFVPRLDLWWIANALRGTLPEHFKTKKPDEIAQEMGWACYHMVPDFTNMMRGPEDILHRALGLYNFKQSVYTSRFPSDVEIRVEDRDGQQVIDYHTPVGSIRTVGGLTEAMQRAGASLGWTQEHAIKGPADYKVVGYIFENLEVSPNYEGALEYSEEVGDCGVVAVGGPSLGASPMHHIQKEFLDPTQFFYEHEDNYALMAELSEKVGVYFDKALRVIEEGPGDVVLWGGNYDDMLTYPPYFEKEILPWLQKVSERMSERGKILATHTDGENRGLMDLIRECGAQVAESVTPFPMTKVRIEEYYARWSDRMTIMGGIPECLLLEETGSEEELDDYLDNLFRSVAPGNRLILGIADSTPPNAVFDRLIRIGDRIAEEGRLPLEAGGARPVSEADLARAAERVSVAVPPHEGLLAVREALLKGDGPALNASVEELLGRGVPAQDILDRGMLQTMEEIGAKFKTGDVFIPEVLLSARAMNQALLILEPHLVGGKKEAEHKVLIGTVSGDLHDIGKNMVVIMLRGVGFEIRDVGINVTTEDFVREVREYEPEILGLSALLTTTMPMMRNVIDALEEAGLRDRVKVLVGGAPVNQRYADEIGADAYAPDAGASVEVAKKLVGRL